MAVHEEEINIRIASALSSDFGIDSRAERTKHRKRPDIVCYENGLLIGIECSYQKSDAEKDALARIKQQYSEIVIALWYKEEFPNVSEQGLRSNRLQVLVYSMLQVPFSVRVLQ